MSKRECHPKFSELHTNSKNPKNEMDVTQNLVNYTQKKLNSTQNGGNCNINSICAN
jgi:hypothetical protein